MSYQSLAELHAKVVSQSAQEEKLLEKEFARRKQLFPDGGDEVEWIVDDVMLLGTQVRWSALLHVVAVYHQLESEIVALAKWRVSGLPAKEQGRWLWQMHKWDGLKKFLKDACDTRLSTVSDYSTVNEMRTVCNSIKHTGGLISRELAKLMGKEWKEGQPIDFAKLDLERYRRAALAFLSDLHTKCEAGVRRKLGAPPSPVRAGA